MAEIDNLQKGLDVAGAGEIRRSLIGRIMTLEWVLSGD